MEELSVQQARELRQAYDALSPEERAALQRAPDANAIMMERVFWKLAGSAPDSIRLRLAHLVACFSAAPQLENPEGFRPGAFLRKALYPSATSLEPAEAARYRQLVQARDVDELVPRIRKVLAAAKAPVDWGVLGRDLFAWSDKVRKAWDKDFYAAQG
ncbi:MAG: type I-E CRISPR-associated protein Cse2/CasB [Myxococcales bacterium]|jgi:CRISPR type I-E-associated protein CasB/Cse2